MNERIINHKGTRRVKDGEDNKLEKFIHMDSRHVHDFLTPILTKCQVPVSEVSQISVNILD